MNIPTVRHRQEMLQQGADILAPVLIPHGFQFSLVASGNSSGGVFAQGEFVRGDRKLELHLRQTLGLVSYHIGAFSVLHDDYMRALLGRPSASHYPVFSEDVFAAFKALQQDLMDYGSDFVSGTGEQFRQCVQQHEKYLSLSGIQKMELGGG